MDSTFLKTLIVLLVVLTFIGLPTLINANKSKSLDTAIELAESGILEAQLALAVSYDHGNGVEQDFRKAAYWYTKAAMQGNGIAQYSLALLYDRGEGVQKDSSKAIFWYTESANNHQAKAQHNLGVKHAIGEEVEKSLPLSYMYFKLASSSLNDSKNALAGLSKLMTPEQIEEGQRLTREWLAAHPPEAD